MACDQRSMVGGLSLTARWLATLGPQLRAVVLLFRRLSLSLSVTLSLLAIPACSTMSLKASFECFDTAVVMSVENDGYRLVLASPVGVQNGGSSVCLAKLWPGP